MFNVRVNPSKILILYFWMFLLFIGCQSEINENNGISFVTETTTTTLSGNSTTTAIPTRPILQSVTITWAPTLVSSNLPTLEPTPTPWPTKTVIPTPWPTKTMIPTPWPTLSQNEAIEKILSLLEDNQNPNCLLPCWWGIIPGQTSWWDVQGYLQSFSLQIYQFPLDSLYEVVFPVPDNVNYMGEFGTGYVLNESDIVIVIGVSALNISGYDPVTMMALYGVPDEVWLHATGSTPTGVLPFQLIMVYQERGISFRYYVEATTDGEVITACFAPGVEVERPELFPAGPRIYLWVPGEYKTIEEISPIPWETYFPLESKTDLTVQSLYDRFMNPDEPPCIDTPVNLW